MTKLTDRAIQGARPSEGKDVWLSDSGARGAGRLYLRVQASGRKSFYWRYTGPSGERVSLALGEYSQKSDRYGLSLAEARQKANELSRIHASGIKDVRGHLEAEARAHELAEAEKQERARREEEESRRGSLRSLVNSYCNAQERAEKIDVKDAKSIFRLHLLDPFPELADRRASDIETADLRQVLARLIEAGKGRTAAKLRSYLSAAYRAASKAQDDPTAPASLLGFGIDSNPCSRLASLSQFNRAGERTLTETELREYLIEVESLRPMTRDALLMALYLGGQRPTQLLRVSPTDVDIGETDGEIRLRDPKGARKAPRLHPLPLTGKALGIVRELIAVNGDGRHLFSSVEGKGLQVETLSKAVHDISAKLQAKGISRRPFNLSDLRRTCETMLAAMRVSRDERAQLLSHGLSGVQHRHYDRHDYDNEKRAVLRQWEQRLTEIRHQGAA